MAATNAWHTSTARVYLWGLRISAIIAKKPGVPEKAKRSVDTELMAVVKDGLPMIL